MGRPKSHSYVFGPFRLQPVERRLLRYGEPVLLTPKAFDTLQLLVQNCGHVLTRDELMKRIWPDTIVEENNLEKNISFLRKALGEGRNVKYVETVPRRGYRFVVPVSEFWDEDEAPMLEQRMQYQGAIQTTHGDGAPLDAKGTPGSHVDQDMLEETNAGLVMDEGSAPGLTSAKDRLGACTELQPMGGAVPLESKFYITRPADHEFQAAIARHDSVVLVKGARQVGKTSLLARGLERAREVGAKVALTDLQELSVADLASAQTLFLRLAKAIAEALELDVSIRSTWDADDSANANFGRFMRREVLKKIAAPVVWALDEVDRLFMCDFGSEVFGLFRSWHNRRALDPQGPWQRLTLAMTYATEAHLFITDVNQSPFNVGTRLALDDFTCSQVAELNRRYGSPLQNIAEVDRFYWLVGGHPYLAQVGFHELARGVGLLAFEAQADRDDGPLGNHLRRVLVMLTKDRALSEIVRGVIEGRPCPTEESFYRLRSAGVMIGDSASNARPRCPLYAGYLQRHLV